MYKCNVSKSQGPHVAVVDRSKWSCKVVKDDYDYEEKKGGYIWDFIRTRLKRWK